MRNRRALGGLSRALHKGDPPLLRIAARSATAGQPRCDGGALMNEDRERAPFAAVVAAAGEVMFMADWLLAKLERMSSCEP